MLMNSNIKRLKKKILTEISILDKCYKLKGLNN
jgi:hypothetical protein